MKATLTVNKNYTVGAIDPRIYGSFIEHLGRAVYGGIYEPSHESADRDGFRQDVLSLVKRMNVPVVRYPGGNFVSGYRWEDGIGPKEQRPKRMELAWEAIETNEVGIDEFQAWAKKAGAEVMMAVNLGTRGAEDAKNLVEYCNLDTDTHYSRMRKENGFEKPFGIKVWCLGNEMDGNWQIGSKTAEEYGKLARETAKMMKLADPSIELVACGSSNYGMRTFGSWELAVLDEVYDHVDYVSMHQYYGNQKNNYYDFLSRSVHMSEFIRSVAAICDAVKAKKHSRKSLNISFDEWNVWFHSNGETYEKWQTGVSRLEDIYTFEDALLVGCMLMTLQNHADRVKMACLAQLVNVIAPIMTQTGGGAWAQTIFYPFAYASQNGRGVAMQTVCNCESYLSSDKFRTPYLEHAVIHNEERREITVFAVNRSLEEDMALDIAFENFERLQAAEHIELYADDLKAVNTAEQETVAPAAREIAPDQKTVILKKHSWNMIRYTYESKNRT